jgi:hypothetical protein
VERSWSLNLSSEHSFGRYESAIRWLDLGDREMRGNLGYSYPSVDVNLHSGVSVFGCRDTSGFCALMVGMAFLEGTLTLAADKEALTIVQTAGKIKLILQCAWRGVRRLPGYSSVGAKSL